MSSDGSVTSNESRIRQFGLYRTIDARTEEFLRSSRKKQIRQGCACAAISTAITVTVVVSVILVYEYSVNAESHINKKIGGKANWIGLMNESDLAALDSKFNKKINFDKTTLKLLPILLKALNKNRYLEKIIDDYSSSSPPLEKESSEETFKRNIFSDSKNWLKMPTSKLYTTDYKTSPLVYWKSPTQRLEYLTKIRKIRDYQRMLNYFDKMVNEKVGSNQKREYEFTERAYVAETVPMKLERVKQMMPKRYPVEKFKNVKEFAPHLKENIANCKCPKKLGQLLSKLINGIQDMVPHMITKKIGAQKCGGNDTQSTEETTQQTTSKTFEHTEPKTTKSHSTIPIRSKNHGGFLQSFQRFTTKSTTIPRKHFVTKKRVNMNYLKPIGIYTRRTTTTSTSTSTTSTTTPKSTFRKSTSTATRTMPTTKRTYHPRVETTTSTTTVRRPRKLAKASTEINNFYDQNFERISVQPYMAFTPIYDKNNLDYDLLFKGTEPSHMESTSTTPKIRTTTEPFVPMRFVDSSKEEAPTEKVVETYTVDTYVRPTVPIFREEDYDDYFGTTAKYTNDFENLDVHSLELVKTKMMAGANIEFKAQNNLKKLTGKSKPLNYHPVVKQKNLDLISMKKMADILFVPEDKTVHPEEKTIQVESKYEPVKPTPVTKMSFQSYKNQVGPRLRTKITNVLETNTSITDTKFSGSVKNSVKISSSETDIKLEPIDTKLAMDQQANSDNIGEEDFQDEYAFKNDASTVITPYPRYENTTRRNSFQEIELQELPLIKPREEKPLVKSSESMLPSMRPIYLEIQRNGDWRQDANDATNNMQMPDYDANFNNNFFDLPNN